MAFLEETKNTEQPQPVETPQNVEPPKKEKLWKFLSDKKLYSKTYPEFEAQFSSPEKVEKLYEFAVKENVYSKGKEDFYSQFFEDVKKKEQSTPSQTGKQVSVPTEKPLQVSAKNSQLGVTEKVVPTTSDLSTKTPRQLEIDSAKLIGNIGIYEDRIKRGTANEDVYQKYKTDIDEYNSNINEYNKKIKLNNPKAPEVKPITPVIDLKNIEQKPIEGDLIEDALKIPELSNAVLVSDVDGIVTTSKDENAINQANALKQKIKEQGFDADELAESFKDFPKELFNNPEYSKEKLLKLRQDNPSEFFRTIASVKWQSPLVQAANAIKSNPDDPRNKTVLSDWNEILKGQQANKDYQSTREHAKEIANFIYKYIDDTKLQDQIFNTVGRDIGFNYGEDIKGKKEVLDSDPRKQYLNENELLGLQFLEDTNPKLANTFQNVLIDPNKLDVNAYGDKVDRGGMFGLQQQKSKLAEQGLALKMNYLSEQISKYQSYIKNGGQATEDKVNQYNKYVDDYNNLQKEAKELTNPNNKEYGAVAKENLRGLSQELFGQQYGFAVNQGNKFMTGVGNAVGSLYGMVADVFRNQDEQKTANLERIGRSIKDAKNTYTTQDNTFLKHFEIQETPEFTQQKNAILNDPNLTQEQKIEKGIELLSSNKGWEVKQLGGKTNIKGLGYAIADTINGLGQFILTSTALGGTGMGSKLNVFTSTVLQGYESKLQSNLQNNEPQAQGKALLSSLIDGALFASADKLGAIKKLFNPETPVGKVVSELSEAELNKMVNSKVGFSTLLKSILESGKHSAPMVAAGVAGTVANDALLGQIKAADDYLKEGLVQQAMFTLVGVPFQFYNQAGRQLSQKDFAETLFTSKALEKMGLSGEEANSVAQNYQKALKISEDKRTPEQNNLIKGVQSYIEKSKELPTEVTPEVKTTEGKGEEITKPVELSTELPEGYELPKQPTEVTTTTEITPIENPKVVITGTTRGMKVLESNTEFSDIKDARGEGRVFDENGILTESDGKGNTIVNIKVDGIDSLGREGYLQTSIIVPEGTKINEGSIKKIVDAQIEKIKSKDNKFLELDKIQKSDFTALKDAVVNELKNPSIKPTEAIQPEVKITIDSESLKKNTQPEVDRVKNLPLENEDGATFNLDGTKHEGGLVVPVESLNTTRAELTPELINDFVEKNKDKISGDNFKVGIYKFPNSEKVSIDLNIVVDPKFKDAALEFGKLAGQESLFDLDSFQNVKTGATGENPKSFTPKEFFDIAKSLAKGEVPEVVKATEAKPTEIKAEVKAEPKTVADTVADDLFTHLGIEPEGTEATTPRVYTSENVSELTSEGLKGDQKAAVDSVKNVVAAIDKLVEATTGNKLKVSIYDNQSSFTKGVEEYGGSKQDSISKGFYMSEDGTIHINMSRASSETMLHEGFHPVLDYLAANKPEIIDNFHKQLSKIKGGDKIIADAERAYKGMGDTTIKKEAITDFIAKIADPNNPLQLDKTNFEKVKAFVLDMLEKMGLKFDKDIRTIDDLKKLAQVISKKFNTGEEIKTEIQYKEKAQNSNSSEGINNDFNTDNIKGKSDRGIQLSKETSRLDDETIKAVKTSIINYKSIPNLKISRTLFYDNTRVGKLEIKNRNTGYTPDVTGKGGFFFSYMPEALKNKAVLAFTSINQAIQTLKRQRLYPDAAQAIAAQNFQTAHLGNKSTLKALFGEIGSKELGVFQESVKNNPKGEIELLNALKDSTISIANKTVKSGVKAGKPTASALEIKKIIDRNGGSLDNIKSIDEFRDKVLTFKGGDSFGARNILFTEILQEKPTKVTKSTRDAHQIMHYKYGIPTLSEIAEGNNQKQLNNAETGDVIKLVKPYSEPIVYTTDKNIYKQYSENPTPEMIDNGIKIELLPEGLNHESYAFVLKGENVGILDNYISAPQLYEANKKIKNIPKKQSFYNVGRMPAKAAPGEYPREPISQGVPQWSRGEDLIEQTGKRKEMTEDDKGNYLFFHYSDKKFNKLSPEKVGKHLATGRDERTSIPTSSLYTRPDRLETNVPSDFGYITRVPKEKVYSFTADPLNLMAEAEARFKKENKDRAFDANNQFAYVAKVASEKGFPITVAEWNIKGTKALIAKTTEALPLEKYTNIKAGTTNQIEFAKGTEDIKPNAKRRDIQFSKESQDAKIKDFIEMQREKGISDKDIKAGLEKAADRIGLDKNKIDELLTTKKEGAGEAGGKRTGMEQAEQGAIFPKEGKPSEAEVGGAEKKIVYTEAPKTAAKVAELNRVRGEFGLPEFEETEQVPTLRRLKNVENAIADLKKSGKYEEELNRIKDRAARGEISDEGQDILTQRLADLRATAKTLDRYSPEYDKITAQIKDVTDTLKAIGTILGRGLEARKHFVKEIETVHDIEENMLQDLNTDTLTKAEKDSAQQKFDEYQKINEAAEKALQAKNEELAKLKIELEEEKAKNELLKQQKAAQKTTPKTKDDYKKERESIKQSIKDKWNNAGKDIISMDLPYRKQLAAITPEVSKLVYSYLEQAAKDPTISKKVKDIVEFVKKELKEFGINISDREALGLVSGEYMEKQQTRNELSKERYELQKEADLLSKIDDLQNDIVKEKDTDKQRKKSTVLKDLEKQLDDLQKQMKVGKYSDEARFEATAKQQIAANKKKIEEIQQKIKKGDFAPETKKESILLNEELQKKNPAIYNEWLETQVKKEDWQKEYEYSRLKDQAKQLTWGDKFASAGRTALNTYRTAKATGEISTVLVQNIEPSLNNPRLMVKFIYNAFKNDLLNGKKFKKEMAILKNSELGDLLFNKMKLALYEPMGIREEAMNELLGGNENLLNKTITIGGKKYSFGQAFERLVDSYANNLRVSLASREIEYLLSKGKTWDNAKEEYIAAGRRINEESGHGQIAKPAKSISKYLNMVIWSTKMMASTFNVLGMGDLIRPLETAKQIGREAFKMNIPEAEKASKGYYTSLTPRQRMVAARNLGQFALTGLGIMGMIKLLNKDDDDVKVTLNPFDSSFGIKIGDKQVNPFGRYAAYMTGLLQVYFAMKYREGEKQVLGVGYKGDTSGDVAFGKFIRGKMRPDVGLAYDYKFNNGKNYFTKEKIKLSDLSPIPMTWVNLFKDIQRDKISTSLWNVPYQFIGGQVRDQRDFEESRAVVKQESKEERRLYPIKKTKRGQERK